MTPFQKHQGRAAVLWRENIDTDQIIPKDFLKSIKRTGFGKHLFSDWRYLDDGRDHPGFELNRAEFKDAAFLIVGNNFGCGSSREHAVWAVLQYGFKAVIAPTKTHEGNVIPGFADIFRNNSLKNGLLTVELAPADVEELKEAVLKNPNENLIVDLEHQSVRFQNIEKKFAIDSSTKEKLLHGWDDIGMTLRDESAISAFEAVHDTQTTK